MRLAFDLIHMNLECNDIILFFIQMDINFIFTFTVSFLGTLITEFDKGTHICDEKIFRSTTEMRSFAKSLAEITKIFGFDGWLLNIENEVKNMDILKEFVPYFTNLIHQDNQGNLVIWYDSVTEKGVLRWQNALNKQNRYEIMNNFVFYLSGFI